MLLLITSNIVFIRTVFTQVKDILFSNILNEVWKHLLSRILKFGIFKIRDVNLQEIFSGVENLYSQELEWVSISI